MTEAEAEVALRRAVPVLDRYLARGNIEIRAPRQQFFQGGAFGCDGVVHLLHDNLERALATGRAGMRVAASAASLLESDPGHFREFERELSRSVADRRLIMFCHFPVAG